MLKLYAAAEALWRGARGPLTRWLGEERLGKLLDAAGLRSFKSRHFRLERALPDGSRLVYRPHDQCIIDEIYLEKAYGPDSAFSPGQIVVDVGGHIGVFAVYAARRVGPAGRVVACEPGPENAALLRDNAARNGLSNVSVREVAVSDGRGRGRLYVPESAAANPAANTLFKTSGRRAVDVELATLDDVAAAENLTRVDHLKIDIEGAELAALRGATRTLSMTARVIMEVHPQRIRPQDALDLLEQSGFSPRVLSKKPGSWLVEALRR